MKRLLIIRSASFQQLDSNLQHIRKKFPRHEIHLLTHEHGKRLARKYKDVNRIWGYPHRGGFSFRKVPDDLKKHEFDAVIIPVTNLSGAGFMNVFLFSLRIPAGQRHVCNLVSEITPISRREIVLSWMRNHLFRIPAVICAGFCGAIVLALFLFKNIIRDKQ